MLFHERKKISRNRVCRVQTYRLCFAEKIYIFDRKLKLSIIVYTVTTISTLVISAIIIKFLLNRKQR